MTTASSLSQSYFVRANKILDRPATVFLGVYVVLFILLNYAPFFDISLGIPTLYALILILPVIPAFVIEERMQRQKNSITNKQMAKIKRHRIDFILGGFASSIIVIPIAIALKIIVTKFYFYSPGQFYEKFDTFVSTANGATLLYTKWYRTILFVFVLYISTIYVTSLFYKTYTRFSDGKESLYFNSKFTLQSLIAYYMIGANFIPLVFWLANHQLYDSIYQDFTPVNQLDFIDRTTLYSLPFMLLLTMAVPMLVMWNITFMEHVIHDNEIRLPNLRKIRDWLIKTSVLIIGIMILLHGTIKISGATLVFFHLFPLVFCGIAAYLMSQLKIIGKECPTCHYISPEEECPICLASSPKSILSITSKRTKHPRCPNCSNPWLSMSRQCSFCQYSIILSCEYCMNTINPLWTKCNLCGKPREPIPDIALLPKSSVEYALSRSKLLILTLLVLPFLFYEITFIQTHSIILNTRGDIVNSDVQKIIAILSFDDYIRVLTFILAILIIILFVAYTRSLNKQHSFLLIMQLAYAGANMFFLSFYLISAYELFLWITYLIRYHSLIFIVPVIFLVFIGLIVLNIRNRTKKLREFSLYVRSNGNDILVLR